MATALALMTADEARGTGLDPAHSDGLTKINAGLGATNLLVSGTATIALGAAAVTISAATLGGSYGGKPAFASVMQAADATLTNVLRVQWSTNDLVITGNANATADTVVAFFVDGRA